MIKDYILNINRYCLNSNFELLKKLLSDNNGHLPETAPPFKIIPLNYQTKNFDFSKFEIHSKNLDLHYIIEGDEEIGITNYDALFPNTQYDPVNDFQLFSGAPDQIIKLGSGEFLILFPDEAHVTGGMVKTSTRVEKVVIKIPI